MKNDVLRIAVAESSVIVRNGVLAILRRMPDVGTHSQIIELTSMTALQNCIQTHMPDILIVNPAFEGWFDIDNFKSDSLTAGIKCVALVCNITGQNILKKYDEVIDLFEDEDSFYRKIEVLSKTDEDDSELETEALSLREKEIIICVVKGMTNKEIADKLFISIHTVITHRRNISRKLQIHSPAGLTIYAIVNKLVELSEVKM